MSPDKQRHSTHPAVTWDHLFKSQPYQKEVSWSKMVMLTNSEPVMSPSMAHTCKATPEPPPKGQLLIKSSKLRWSTASNFGGKALYPKSQLHSIQESMQSPSSKFGLMFESSIMGPKRIKHATMEAPVINVHNDSKCSRPFPLVKMGRAHMQTIVRAPRKSAMLITKTASALSISLNPTASVASLIPALLQKQGHKNHHTCGRSHEVYPFCDDKVARLGKVALTDNVGRLREIALATTMLQGLSLFQKRGC
jgi:hypothetical protein